MVDNLKNTLIVHNVNTERLKSLYNPFTSWVEQKEPITKEEVLQCLENGEEELVEHKMYSFNDKVSDKKILENRINHIKKIAYFVKNKPNEPIKIDAIFQGLSIMLEDGNHRFAANIIKGRETTKSNIMGEEGYIKELGLWSPNIIK